MICFDVISCQRAIFLLFLFIIKRTAVLGFDFFCVQKRKKDSRFGQHPVYDVNVAPISPKLGTQILDFLSKLGYYKTA